MATIKRVQPKKAPTSALVKYAGWPRWPEEWVPVARARKLRGAAARSLDQERIKYKGKMKGRVARGVYERDRLIRKARRAGRPGYIVRWRGYTEEDDTFEPNANIPRQWRDEFEEEQRRGREAPPTPKPPKPPKAPRVPRVVELTAHEPEELRRQRVADAPADAYQLQVAAAARLKRASEPKHALKLCSLEGVTASRFDGLRRWLIAEQVAGADSGGAAPGAEGEPRGPGKHRRQAGVTGEAARRGAEGIG